MYFTIRSQHAIVKTTRGTVPRPKDFCKNSIVTWKLLQNEKEEVTMKKAFEKIEAFLERYYKGIAPAYKM